MIDFKKMDNKDFVFENKPLNDKEEKEFSNFLKLRKQKQGGYETLKKLNFFTANMQFEIIREVCY